MRYTERTNEPHRCTSALDTNLEPQRPCKHTLSRSLYLPVLLWIYLFIYVLHRPLAVVVMSKIGAFDMRKKKTLQRLLFIYRKTKKKTVMVSSGEVCFPVAFLAQVAVVEPIIVQRWLNVVNCMSESSMYQCPPGHHRFFSSSRPVLLIRRSVSTVYTWVASRTTQVVRAAKTVVKWFIIVDPLINSILINYLVDRLCSFGRAVLHIEEHKTEERYLCPPAAQHIYSRRRKRPRLRIVAIKRKRRRRQQQQQQQQQQHRIEHPFTNTYPMEVKMIAVPLVFPSTVALARYQQQQNHPWCDLPLSEEALSTCCCS